MKTVSSISVLHGLDNRELHRLTDEVLTPVLNQLDVSENRRLKVRRPFYPDVALPVAWLHRKVSEEVLVYVRGLTTGHERLLLLDLQRLLTALRVHGDDLYVMVMPATPGPDQEECFIVPDPLLREWDLVRGHYRVPGLAERVAKKARAGA